MENIEIRPATLAEVPLILQFIQELAEYERLAHEVVATSELLREQLFGSTSRQADAPAGGAGAEVVIAYVADQPVGFALFFHNFSTFLGRRGLYLEDLYVRPTQRGQGVGRALLVYLARLAQTRGCGRLDWAVLNWNEPALRFYRSLGAVPLNEWTGFRLTGAALQKLAE
jgi:GNAT superfamily N-acetyltransferase